MRLFGPSNSVLLAYAFTFISVYYFERSMAKEFKTYPGADEEVIHVDESTIGQVVLKPEKGIRFQCPNKDYGDEYVVTLYPSDPRKKTLLPLEGHDFEGSVTNEVFLRDIFRSDGFQISVKNPGKYALDVDYYYDRHGLLMAKDPESFSLNIACKYQPHDRSKPPIYYWLKIIPTDVYPMAYGCESGHNMLFKNTVPRVPNYPRDDKKSQECEIAVEPGMIFGIYCALGETLMPENCLNNQQLYKMNGDIMPYSHNTLLNDATRNVKKRFQLFKVSKERVKTHFKHQCFCQGPRGITKVLKFYNNVNGHIDTIPYMTSIDPEPQTKRFVPYDLAPGMQHHIVLPRSTWVQLGKLGKVRPLFSPKNPEYMVFYGNPSSITNSVSYDSVLGIKNFRLNTLKMKDEVIYSVNYREDAVMVLKTDTPMIYYDLALKGYVGSKIDITMRIMFFLFPTDPYTYGCGVDSTSMFKESGFLLSHVDGEVTTTKCKVNPYLSSPVGFYCPKGFTLEPPNCFGNMFHGKTNEVVSLSNYAHLARYADGKHIKVADFHVPLHMKSDIKYTEDELSCRCSDKNGRVRASITLDLRNPTDPSVTDEYHL